MQKIIVLLIMVAAVYFLVARLVKDYRSKKCDDCALKQGKDPDAGKRKKIVL